MTDDTQKDAIESMKRAQANMKAVLDRNSKLEDQLRTAVNLCERLIKNHVSNETYLDDYNRGYKRARDMFTERLDAIRKHLP